MIGTGLALLRALGRVTADIPEDLATIAGFRRREVSRPRRRLVSAAFAASVLLGASIGYGAVRGACELVQV